MFWFYLTSWSRPIDGELVELFERRASRVQHLHTSMDKVYSIVRKTYDRRPTDEMEDLNVNAAIWRMFMNTTLQASVHLGQDYDKNLRFVKNHFWSSLKKLCKETEKLIKNQTEIIGLSTIDYGDHTWSATSLLCDNIHQIPNANTYVFPDSVLCLGGIKENPNEALMNFHICLCPISIVWNV